MEASKICSIDEWLQALNLYDGKAGALLRQNILNLGASMPGDLGDLDEAHIETLIEQAGWVKTSEKAVSLRRSYQAQKEATIVMDAELAVQTKQEFADTRCRQAASRAAFAVDAAVAAAAAVGVSPCAKLPLEQCPVCLQDVPHVPHKNTYMRLTCCGKTAHTKCYQQMKAKNSSEEAKNKCGLCRETYPRRGTPKVIKRLRKWVNKGKAWAQTMLANAYEMGEGVQPSCEQARHWFELAVKQGDPMAHAGLGYLYQHGHGVEQNYKKAVALYRVAAEEEEPGAQNNLGWMYRDGLGVEQSYEQAIVWFQRAAAHGDMQANYNLGFLYYNGKGVAKSYKNALDCYMAASSAGHAKSMYNVGNMYDDGHGVTQSHERAITFWKQAASHGHINATVNIGASYQDGEGIEQSLHKAREWYTKAVMLGDQGAFDLVKQVDAKIEEERSKLDTTHCSMCNKEETDDHKLVFCPCKYSQYCNSECQQKHWKKHKKNHRESIMRVPITSLMNETKESQERIQATYQASSESNMQQLPSLVPRDQAKNHAKQLAGAGGTNIRSPKGRSGKSGGQHTTRGGGGSSTSGGSSKSSGSSTGKKNAGSFSYGKNRGALTKSSLSGLPKSGYKGRFAWWQEINLAIVRRSIKNNTKLPGY